MLLVSTNLEIAYQLAKLNEREDCLPTSLHVCEICNYSRPFTEWPATIECPCVDFHESDNRAQKLAAVCQGELAAANQHVKILEETIDGLNPEVRSDKQVLLDIAGAGDYAADILRSCANQIRINEMEWARVVRYLLATADEVGSRKIAHSEEPRFPCGAPHQPAAEAEAPANKDLWDQIHSPNKDLWSPIQDRDLKKRSTFPSGSDL